MQERQSKGRPHRQTECYLDRPCLLHLLHSLLETSFLHVIEKGPKCLWLSQPGAGAGVVLSSAGTWKSTEKEPLAALLSDAYPQPRQQGSQSLGSRRQTTLQTRANPEKEKLLISITRIHFCLDSTFCSDYDIYQMQGVKITEWVTKEGKIRS